MRGYGLIFLSLPLMISYLIMRYKGEIAIVYAGIMVVVLIFIMISRRDMAGVIEWTLIISFFVNYIYNKKPMQFIWRFINLKSIIYGIIILTAIWFIFPNFYSTTQTLFENTFRTAILGEESNVGNEDVRMSLTGQYGIVNAILDNFFLGTGYNKDWASGDGGVSGFEGSDYIFLASFGMYGLVGLLIFLPFYIIAIKIIISFLKLVKSNIELIWVNKKTFMYPILIGFATSAEFIKNIIEYPNWFFPIGSVDTSPKYFIYFALLLGSYRFLKKYITVYKLKLYKEK
jgi:hypothetical protein